MLWNCVSSFKSRMNLISLLQLYCLYLMASILNPFLICRKFQRWNLKWRHSAGLRPPGSLTFAPDGVQSSQPASETLNRINFGSIFLRPTDIENTKIRRVARAENPHTRRSGGGKWKHVTELRTIRLVARPTADTDGGAAAAAAGEDGGAGGADADEDVLNIQWSL